MRVSFRGLKLSPCPFDGKKCFFYKGEHAEHDIKVICTGCGVEGPLCDDSFSPVDGNHARANAEVAAQHWNTRK